MPRILTPGTHSQETLAIAHDLLPTGYELVTAPHGRPEFLELLKDTEFYIGAGQFKRRLYECTEFVSWTRGWQSPSTNGITTFR